MKKITAVILTFMLLLGTVAIGVPEEGVRFDFGLRAFAASEVANGICGAEGDNLTWVLDSERTLTISGTGDMDDWADSEWLGDIPWYIDYGETITKVVINDGVTSIGSSAFLNCNSLEEVVIPDSVTRIGEYAFEGCYLLEDINFPNSVTFIGSGAFCWCTSIESVVIPEGITTIESFLFSECSSMRNVTIHDSVTTIKENAFYECSSLESIEIPCGVAEIGREAFTGCEALKSINVAATNDTYKSVDGVVFSKDGKTLMVCPSGKEGSFTVPSGTEAIEDTAFSGCRKLERISFPDSLTSIGNSAFAHCDKISEFDIPAGVTAIGSSAFFSCDSITEICIPNGVKVLEDNLFEGCRNLAQVHIPSSVETIDSWAFNMCDSLAKVEIPESVVQINEGAFANCTSLTEVSIPEGVRIIVDSAFRGGDSLTRIYLSAGIEKIEMYAFEYSYDLSDIYYAGSKTEWQTVDVSPDAFSSSVTVHYNSPVPVVLSDKGDNVRIVTSSSETSIDSKTELAVQQIQDKQDIHEILMAIGKRPEKIVLYDVSLTQNGEHIQPTSPVKVKIKIPDGFKADESKIIHISDDLKDEDMNAVAENGYFVFTADHFSYYAVVEGEAPAPARLSGDVNGDGKISMLDSTVLRRWLAGWDVTISEANADVNGDGKVDMKDSIILRRYLAGWDGVELR